MHVVTTENTIKVKENIREELKECGIGHVTIEIEDKDEKCTELSCKMKEKSVNNHHHHH